MPSDDVQAEPLPTQAQIAVARKFVESHGEPSKLVVENLGRAGARAVLIGADGALGDLVVSSVSVGEALAERVTGLEIAQWDAATVNAVQIGPAHRRRMAGRPR